jgi:signal peptidase II
MAVVDSRGPRTAAAASTPWLSLLAVGLYVVALDQLTKDFVRSMLSPGEGLHLAGFLWIQPFRNPGIAGGGLSGGAVPAALFATAVVLALLLFLARQGAAGRTVIIGFGLLIGGGMGNLLDRVRFGYVTDFILHGDQVFNLADVAIFVGCVVIVFGLCEILWRTPFRQRSLLADD